LANFLSVSISAHTPVVAGSMYPPKTIGFTGAPILGCIDYGLDRGGESFADHQMHILQS
jgi:hypothetical protein